MAEPSLEARITTLMHRYRWRDELPQGTGAIARRLLEPTPRVREALFRMERRGAIRRLSHTHQIWWTLPTPGAEHG